MRRCSPDVSADFRDAVRLVRGTFEPVRYTPRTNGKAAQIESQSNVIKLRSAQLANRIALHLALGGSFDLSPAAQAAR
jgi:hypothetical protein